MGKKRFYDAVRDLIRDVHDPPEQPSRTRRRLSISSLLAAPQTCAACWDVVPSTGRIFSCNSCLGAFCPPCLTQYARSALSDRQLLPLRCADQSCRAPVPLSALEGQLTAEEIARLSRFQCEMLRKPNEESRPATPSVTPERNGVCNEEALHSLMDHKGWRRCPDCGTGVERTQGCSHMVCLCGGEFCYSCGEPWRAGGLGCPRRCGLPENPDALLGIIPARFEELRDQVWQRIAALLESLREHLERDRMAHTLQPLETWQREMPRVAAVRDSSLGSRVSTRSSSRGTRPREGQPAKMRLSSLVYPSIENRL